MTFEGSAMRLWSIEGPSLVSIDQTSLANENQLEDWLEQDIDILDADLMVIGRQIGTPHGGRIDLVAISEDGSLTVIELKRDKTSRDIVAQILDYASWVGTLDTPDVFAIADAYFSRRSSSLATEFLKKFGKSVPDSLNQSHWMVIVASSLDPASERIVEYLGTTYDIGINTAFFNVFDFGDQKVLAANWQLDQEEVVERTQRRVRAPWSGIYYVNVGDGPSRSWDDMRKYGFIAAGGGSFYSQRLYQLSEGDTFFAYQRQHGYVGKGEVLAKATLARDVEIDGQPLLELPLTQPNLGHDRDNPNLAEHVVLVRWEKTLPLQGALTFSGAFANQNVVCKLRDQATLDFLAREFGN